MTDDSQLEQAFRDGLRQAADRTEVGVPLAAAGARRRPVPPAAPARRSSARSPRSWPSPG